MQPKLLEMEDVCISYHNKIVVHNITFSLEEGEILGIVGESGSGKSTLLRAVIGLLGNGGKLECGRILFRGREIGALSKEELRRLRGAFIGMVFQDCKGALSPIRTIEAQMYEAIAQHQRISKEEAKIKAKKLLEQLKLSDSERVLKSYPFELSGGMNQRVGIMMAMLLKPALLLADEPTSALDVLAQKQVVSSMLELRAELKTGIILVTHNIGVALHMADHILVMQNGRQMEYAETKELIYNPKASYTRKLIDAVPRLKRGF
jgi:peptide/nickel transport system ATP-binding protein